MAAGGEETETPRMGTPSQLFYELSALQKIPLRITNVDFSMTELAISSTHSKQGLFSEFP